MGEALGVEHTAFYQSKADGLAVTHSWPAEKFKGLSDARHAAQLAWIARGLRRKGVLILSQSEAASDTDWGKDFLLRLGLKSAVLVE